MTGGFIRSRKDSQDTHRKGGQVMTESEMWSDASVSQSRPRITRSHQKQGTILPWRLQRAQGPADSLVTDTLPPGLGKDMFLSH